jgi:hypothetical protein
MKNLISFSLALFIVLGISSCKKSSTSPFSLAGKWNLVSDSTYTKNPGAPPVGILYFGVGGDYYNFETNGKLSWREKSTGFDAAVYTASGNIGVSINYFPTADPNFVNSTFYYAIAALTEHKLVLTYGPGPTSGQSGEYGQIITFSR